MSQQQLDTQVTDESTYGEDAGLMNLTGSLDGRLARAFSALTQRQLYPGSESDSPYEPFHVHLEPTQPVTPDALREAMHLAPWWKITLRDGEAWLDEIITWANESGYHEDPWDPAVYELLRKAMHGTLVGPLERATIEAPEVAAFHKTRQILFGRMESGSLAGLIAFSVET